MNKMTMLLGLLVAIMSVSASGVGFIGTPTAELDQGQWNAGFNYMYSDMELAKTTIDSSWVEFDDAGDVLGSGSHSFKLEIDNVKTQRYYGTVGYGLTNVWEAYVQLGIADLKAQTREADDPTDTWSGMNFDNDFAWGWGTRVTFLEQNNIRWGASVQMNWLDTSWDETVVVSSFTEEVQIDFESYDLIIAVGPTVDIGGWKLYGGPFYYMLSGDISMDINGNFPGGSEIVTESGDLEEDSNFGVFVGAQCPLMDKYDVTTELSLTGSGWAFGAGVAVPF